jgi:hypothetical protein
VGCGITPGEQDLYWRQRVLTERGVADDEIAVVLTAWRAFFIAVATGDRTEFEHAVSRALAISSPDELPPDPSTDDPRAWYRNLDVTFDAAVVAAHPLSGAGGLRRTRHVDADRHGGAATP